MEPRRSAAASLSTKVLARAMDSMEPSEEEGAEELVGMGLRVSFSPAQITFYILLVLLGILGNATVVAVIGKNIVRDRGAGNNSDIIIMNMALSNLLVSLMRNTLLVISDIGLEVGGPHSQRSAGALQGLCRGPWFHCHTQIIVEYSRVLFHVPEVSSECLSHSNSENFLIPVGQLGSGNKHYG